MISSNFHVLYDLIPQSLVTRLGVCVQNKIECKLDSLRAFYYDVLLLTTAYSAYAVHFFLWQFPNMELMLLLLSPLFYLLNCYIFVVASLRLLLYNSVFDRLSMRAQLHEQARPYLFILIRSY